MKLELRNVRVNTIEFGKATAICGGVLTVNREELTACILEDRRIGSVDIQLARPGESCRILQVVDIIEPRAKISGGEDFPGVIGKTVPAGEGVTCALKGAAVTLCDQSEPERLSQAEDPLGFILDMSGPAADIHLYGGLNHVVLLPVATGGVSQDGYRAAMKIAGLKAAAYLASAAKEEEPEDTEIFELPPLPELGERDLPRVAYIFMVHCTSYPAIPGEPILYGDNIKQLLPTVLHPNEVLDGGVVNPFDGVGTETYVIQNHPIIRALMARHGRDLLFTGVILTVSRVTEPERERSAMMAAQAAAHVLGAGGVVLTKASSGAPDIDLAQTAQACDDLGVKAVLIIFDRSNKGEAGEVFDLPGARSIVTTANQYEVLDLPPVDQVIGRIHPLEDGKTAAGRLQKTFRFIRGGLDQEGITRIRSMRY